jgi:hypothetical protein
LSVIDHFIGALRFPFGFFLPEVYRLRGECLAALGRLSEAELDLRKARKLAEEQGSELFALRAAIARARCCGTKTAAADIERSLSIIGERPSQEIAEARAMSLA